MSSQHKAPLAAFVAVSVALVVVVISALHNDASALSRLVKHPGQALVLRLPMLPKHVVASGEVHAAAKAKVELRETPKAVDEVVRTADAKPAVHRSTKRAHAGRKGAAQVAVPAPASAVPTVATPVPVAAAPVVPAVPDHASAAQQWQAHGSQPFSTTHGQVGHQSHAASSGAPGWSKPSHDDHGRGAHGQSAQQSSGRQTSGSPTSWSSGAWSPRGHGNGRGNGWGSTWDDSWSADHGNGHGNGRSNGWNDSSRGNGWGNGHHGRH
jgi:hypothetical protein